MRSKDGRSRGLTRTEYEEHRAEVLNAIKDAIEKFGLSVLGYDDTGEFPTVLIECEEEGADNE